VTFVIGRQHGDRAEAPTVHLGAYRARDGSSGAALHLDVDGPHAMLVVGKRGYGKSYTLGVIAEALARTDGLAPVVLDPMGVFGGLAAEGGGETAGDEAPIRATVVEDPTVDPAALDPRSWCAMLDLDPTGAAGSLVWRAAQQRPDGNERDGLAAMREAVRSTDADPAARRAADNHLGLASGWGVFDRGGLDAAALGTGAATVIDVSGLAAAPLNAVCRGVAEALYRGRVSDELDRLPWLLVDEAHAMFAGVAAPALEKILTRGRAPGVSLVLATQRPSAVPAVGVSQADVLVAHRLTSEADLDALARARPTYLETSLSDRLPTATGEVVIVDDATETVHAATVRERVTPHEGESPSLRERLAGEEHRAPQRRRSGTTAARPAEERP